ncbi:hypothetical protein Tco_0927449, partial [Tanacetum coccineum]
MHGDETPDAYLNRAQNIADALCRHCEPLKDKDLVMAYTGANSHVTTSVAYYGDDALHVGNEAEYKALAELTWLQALLNELGIRSSSTPILGIDYFIGISDIPQRAQELPNLMKQGACKAGWFSEKDNEELHSLANEIANNFSSAKDMISGESTFHQTVSSVISRFYPGMRMGGVLAFIEATPGYGAYVKDFYMTANAKASNEKVYLFVARTDTTETSSCIHFVERKTSREKDLCSHGMYRWFMRVATRGGKLGGLENGS